MPPLISVIIPAYNTEELIASTLASVVAQNYGNMEIIVVNDASTDGTGDAARKALQDCGRAYRVIEHEVNRGVSVARNTGLSASQGEYVAFIDSDDLIDQEYISTMYEAIADKSADISVCGYRTLCVDDGIDEKHPLDARGGENASVAFAVRVARGDIGIYFGASIYRKDMLTRNGIKFTEGCACGEDAEFFIKAVSVCGKISFPSVCGYIYRIHDRMGSRTGHTSDERNVKRYTDLINGRVRAGHYIVEHSKIPELVRVAKYELLPRYYLKMFTMYAWRGDRESFFADLRSKNIKNTLMSSWKIFPRSLDITLKSLWLLMFPGMYYEYRRRHVYYYKI
jgi:glycosyltransferase involved in cell wall biosynthesis